MRVRVKLASGPQSDDGGYGWVAGGPQSCDGGYGFRLVVEQVAFPSLIGLWIKRSSRQRRGLNSGWWPQFGVVAVEGARSHGRQ